MLARRNGNGMEGDESPSCRDNVCILPSASITIPFNAVLLELGRNEREAF